MPNNLIIRVTNISLNLTRILTHISHSEKMTTMRIFLSVLLLIFSLQSWTKADDIKDFEIEGISIGDSLLDFYNQDEIKEMYIISDICDLTFLYK